ncbi:hypothetical protein FDF74_06395 [Clostridium niameyense]|uniref:IDEAL domain-containing protein n=1 Tax=Clostridium niameyense TaxID=1622073 RepID=A0A6M0R9B7_9CLOT|nr:hypothetical protein [Clostridium niameyense]NEZ46842.1 hypothetical protein [Clostridium niameyense]
MKIKYIELFWGENNELIYGVELKNNKALNKYIDKIKILHHKHVLGEEYFELCFNRLYRGKVIKNKFYLLRNELILYIFFLKNFNNILRHLTKKEVNIEHDFLFKDQGKIVLSSIGEEFVKLSNEVYGGKRIFFILDKDEFSQYIDLLEKIYYKKNNLDMGYYINNTRYILSKEEKNKLYLDALYAFADEALDKKDKSGFYSICNEIKKLELSNL